MKHKVCLLFALLSLSLSGISATNGQDSLRQIQLNDLGDEKKDKKIQ